MRLFRGEPRIPDAAMIYQAAAKRDEELMAESELVRLRRGDPDALAAAIARYQHRLYRYFVRLVREPAAADDLFQQTWLNVVRNLRRYDASRSFETWLFAIAHHAAMDVLRRKPGEPLEEGDRAPVSLSPDALTVVLSAERKERLAEAMAELPALHREAITLRFEEGMKLEEIAEVTHAPLSTVKSRVQRGLESLRRRLMEEGVR